MGEWEGVAEDGAEQAKRMALKESLEERGALEAELARVRKDHRILTRRLLRAEDVSRRGGRRWKRCASSSLSGTSRMALGVPLVMLAVVLLLVLMACRA